MRCFYCANPETKVVDSREANSKEIRRRRECLKCNKRFTTYERPENDLMVIKKDGRKEAFDQEKIRKGLIKACNKRPITEEVIEKVTNKIEQKIRNSYTEVKSKAIGNLVMKELKKLDSIAYLRFASVCKSFDDVKLFEKEIKNLR